MADVQRTLLLVKPDGVQRLLVGRVLTRFEERGLKLVGLKLVPTDRALAEEHYAVHREKPFFAGLVDFITSGPLVAAALEGPNAIAIVRAMNGATRPARGRAGLDPRRLRRRDRAEPRPRVGQPGERGGGARPVVPPRGAARLRARDRPLGAGARGVDLASRHTHGTPRSVGRGVRRDRGRLARRTADVEDAPGRQRREDRDRQHARGRQLGRVAPDRPHEAAAGARRAA